MKLKIVEKNYPHICIFCGKKIETIRKIFWNNKNYSHINCAYSNAEKNFNKYKEIKRKLKNYKREMLLEKLK